MHYHLVLTQRCNLACTYCGYTIEPTLMPVSLNYSLDHLQTFLEMETEKPVIAFYGGEPCLEYKKIMQVMDEIDAKAFVIQTNGILLQKIPTSYLIKFHSILISIDGRKKLTDTYRGRGTYEKTLDGAIYARLSGFNGDLIARMTVSESSDIYEEVSHLLSLQNPKFDHIHWQLDAMWDETIDTRYDDFSDWLSVSYLPGIRKLVNKWIEHLETKKEILGIVPFMGIMYTLLSKNDVKLRCGAGIDFFSITTDGRITVCPIPPSIDFAVVGDINISRPQELAGKVKLDEPCISCEERHICGGRCLYTNKTKFWGDRGFELVCNATKFLINELRNSFPQMERLVRNKIFSVKDFDYPKISNGVEIIP